jgi:hypothetical protein
MMLKLDTVIVMKEKEKGFRKVIRMLNKRLKEITKSRDHWKQKYLSLANEKSYSKPSRHQYPTVVIALCIYVYSNCHCSFRACATIVAGCSLLFDIDCRKPSASTIRNWVIKRGYYEYLKPHASDEKMCIIIDESVSIGRERLLLILGVPLKDWTAKKPLSHQDTRVLFVGIKESWKAEDIAKELKVLSEKISIGYCVSDRGNSIVAAVKMAGLIHINDCSHEWANLLKCCHGENETFKLLMGKLAMIRRTGILSKFSHLIPPPLRSKARFMNVFPLIGWIERIWESWDLLEDSFKEKLSFLNDCKSQIGELIVLRDVIGEMSAILKTEGMSRSTLDRCKMILNAKCLSGATKVFSDMLQASWGRYDSILQQENSRFICCSDIIESYFGKFKQKINGTDSITDTVLTMCIWGKEMSLEEIEKAFESVKLKDIKVWKKGNTTPSILLTRRQFFAQKCTKKAA